jgi:RHS repeat-associated protein
VNSTSYFYRYCDQPVWGLFLQGDIANNPSDNQNTSILCGGKLPGETCGPATRPLSWPQTGSPKNATTAEIQLWLLYDSTFLKVIDTQTVTVNQKNLGDDQCNVGNPCNPADGNKFQAEDDFRSADKSVFFSRYYNSRLNQDLGFGYGWTTSYQHADLKIGQLNILVQRPNGRGEPFFWNTLSGVWRSDPDSRFTLTQDADGFSLSQRSGAVERYNLVGQIVSDTSATGQTTNYGYDTNGRLFTVTDTFGHTLTFGYDANNHVASITDAAGNIINYDYDNSYPIPVPATPLGNLTRARYPDGTAKIYYYEDPHNSHGLTGIAYVDASGATTRYSTYGYYYNSSNTADPSNGKAILTQHAQTDNGAPQEKFTLTYNTDSQTTVTDPIGTNEVMTFGFNLGVKNLTSKVNQSDGKSVQQTFDTNNNLTCKKNEENRVTTYTYNSTNQKLSMTEGLTGDCANPQNTSVTRTTNYTYLSTTLDLPTVITAPSVASGQVKTTTLQYTDTTHLNLPTVITQSGYTPSGTAVSRSATLGYNASGQVNAINGPRTDVNDVTTLEYYECTTGGACGQLKKVTNALGQITTYDTYDTNGRLTQMTDPNGLITSYSYDPRGRVRFITQIPPAGTSRVTEYRYNAAGNVTQALLPDGMILTYSYDAALYLRIVTDNLGNRIEYKYDLKGNRITDYTYDPSGTLVRQIDRAYDLRNRLSSINAAGSLTQMVFDAVGNLRSETDPNNDPATQYTPDALNRLVQTIDRLSGVTGYGYDINDRVKQVTAPNNAATIYAYDDLGNLLQEISPDRGTTSYTYDTAGNVKTITDARGIQTVNSYDALNRVTLIDYPGTAEDITYIYDTGMNCSLGLGRLCTVTDPSGTTNYAYDAFGNLTTQVKTELSVTYTTAYSYDAGNHLTSITYPDGRVLNYGRDVLGRLTSLTTTVNGLSQPVISNRTYRPDGLVTAETFGNSLSTTRVYDLKGQLRELYLGSADTRLFGYDANGNLLSEQALSQVGGYLYDALDRLIQDKITTTGTTTIAYGYDGNGNRTSENATSYIYLAASNRLSSTSRPKSSFTLNSAGQTLSDGSGRSYTYNSAGQVQQVTLGGVTSNYLYNFQGLRTRKVTGTTTTVYHYDLTGKLLAETTSSGQLQRAYLYADGTPAAQIESATVPPPEVVLDNPQAAYTGTWPTATNLPGYYGSNYQTNTKGTGSDKAVWTPNLPTTGSYQVYARWVAASSNASNAPFTITYSTGSTTVSVNQRSNGGQWMLLGTFPFNSGTAGMVTLTDKANGTVIADAVKFVPITGGTTQEVIRYLHTDHENTPRLVTDQSGTVVWRWDGQAFGMSAPTGSITVNLRYAGQYYDAETGLHYNNARYYDPRIGRYISSDPIGLAGGLNTYLYARANPLKYIDPKGLLNQFPGDTEQLYNPCYFSGSCNSDALIERLKAEGRAAGKCLACVAKCEAKVFTGAGTEHLSKKEAEKKLKEIADRVAREYAMRGLKFFGWVGVAQTGWDAAQCLVECK